MLTSPHRVMEIHAIFVDDLMCSFFFFALLLPTSPALIYDVSIRNHGTFLCNHDSVRTHALHLILSRVFVRMYFLLFVSIHLHSHGIYLVLRLEMKITLSLSLSPRYGAQNILI